MIGAFPIDNNMAELAVRCLTTARNNSFHFGSDLGAQMTATYHSIISMVKFHDSSDGAALVFLKSLRSARFILHSYPLVSD